jgi:hypothetical protein
MTFKKSDKMKVESYRRELFIQQLKKQFRLIVELFRLTSKFMAEFVWQKK